MNNPHTERLSNVALYAAFTKGMTLSAVSRFLMAAQQQCLAYTMCMNTFEGDPEIIALGEKLEELAGQIPQYNSRILQEFGNISLSELQTVDGNEIWQLREEEMIARGLPKPPEDEPLPFEDPLDLYGRLQEELE